MKSKIHNHKTVYKILLLFKVNECPTKIIVSSTADAIIYLYNKSTFEKSLLNKVNSKL